MEFAGYLIWTSSFIRNKIIRYCITIFSKIMMKEHSVSVIITMHDINIALRDEIEIYTSIRYEIYQGDRTAKTAQSYTNGKPSNFVVRDVDFNET